MAPYIFGLGAHLRVRPGQTYVSAPTGNGGFITTNWYQVEPRPYPEEEFQRTRNRMLSWGLAPQYASYEQLVDNRIGAAG
jgi:hypothetical protein